MTPLLIAEGIKIKNAEIVLDKGESITLDYSALPHKYNFLLCLPQNHTEQIMQKRFEEMGGDVQYNTRLVSLTNKKDGTIEAVIEKDGKQHAEVFDAVIGADGVNSRVRQQMGVKLEEHSYRNKWSAAEFDSKDWPHSQEEIQYFLGKGGKFAVVIPLGGSRYRSVANTDDAMACISGKYTVDQLHFNNAFDVSVRNAKDYQKGNIFLAGDAAHAYPPVGVQGGMNLGIKDASSLARRIAEDDTKGYTRERRAASAVTIRESEIVVRIAGLKNPFMTSARDKAFNTAAGIKAIKKQILKESLGA